MEVRRRAREGVVSTRALAQCYGFGPLNPVPPLKFEPRVGFPPLNGF
jgi:hypothetical protein